LSRHSLLSALFAAFLAALALAACGGDDGGGGNSADEEAVITVIEESIGSGDPERCTESATQAFLEQTEFETGEDALESCRESAADTADDPKSIDVSDVEVDGDKATAAITFEGGTFDGHTVEVSLVDESGWKLDRLEDIRDFDPEQFGQAFAETRVKGEDPLTQEQAQCAGDAFAAADADELEEALLSGDQSQLEPFVADC
jgi:hypothetical protein